MLFSSAVLFALASNACLVSAEPNQSYASSCRNRVVTVNGRSCNQQCGVDYPGGDYKSFRTSGYQGCVNACAMDSNCTHASYQCEYGICYLKVNKSYGQSGRHNDHSLHFASQHGLNSAWHYFVFIAVHHAIHHAINAVGHTIDHYTIDHTIGHTIDHHTIDHTIGHTIDHTIVHHTIDHHSIDHSIDHSIVHHSIDHHTIVHTIVHHTIDHRGLHNIVNSACTLSCSDGLHTFRPN
ncbi:hypothetical protein TI39_contig378g00028 [Zymoseptoria brevis]|uniref:Apple domain-containing protein n=1 Tax=Zymoseptoria brevis TaxID=1047168 RepID=A0A0F4GNN3_9PEZI|nr:hypothetical protein TI39_contig378g00028 [Zymoseptoria brevis]